MNPAPASSPARRLRVHVLVDLLWSPSAGGHVKFWERLARAAVERGEPLDLTVHFSGPRPGTHALGEHVRYRVHPPVFSTARLPFLSHVPDHTDLGRFHRGLAEALAGAEVLHTTDAYFAFARTAERLARRRRIPLVSSVHTDTPRYTALYTAATVERLLGPALGRLLGGLSRSAGARMQRRLLAHQRRCAHVLVSRPGERDRLGRALPAARVGLLRRGVDHALFSPARRDRAWLEATFAVPPGRLVLLLVGRIDRGKNVEAAASALQALRGQGLPLHLFCAGDGPERTSLLERLPGAASCPGVLDPETLGRVYASVDLFAHPSRIEESPNAVREAMAAGLPVACSPEAGAFVQHGHTGLVVGEGDWADALGRLARDRDLRLVLGRRARAWAEREVPSWQEVLTGDLLPVWTRAAGRGA